MTTIVKLSNRGVIRVSGQDRGAFLQGLVTNDVLKVTQDQAIYAALLSPQGRYQYDLFIQAEDENSWFIDCDRDRVEMLLKRLSLYKLRSDVILENLSHSHMVIALWGSTSYPFVDPRLGELGSRLILTQEGVDQLCVDLGEIALAPYEVYDHHRISLGIPDGNLDILVDKGIPLECGLDELHAIDWTKGCYMGQELTARTKYRGLVRKRLVPVCIDGEIPVYQSPISQEGADVGELRSAFGKERLGWGIALIRLEALKKSQPLLCGSSTVTPHILSWMKLPDHE